MIITCNHCQKSLKGSDKLLAGLEQLNPGQTLRLKCPHCGQVINLGRDLLVAQPGAAPSPQGATVTEAAVKTESIANQVARQVSPPEPPDLNWLGAQLHGGMEDSEAQPQALILMRDSQARATLATALDELGFLPFFPVSASEALERMRSGNYAVIVLHSRREGEDLADSTFHEFMLNLNMNRRRSIFYVLIGPELKTLYNLQALSLSANLVLNEQELVIAKTVLHMGLHQYHELFDPLLEELNADINR